MSYINTNYKNKKETFLPSNFHYLIIFPDVLLYLFLPLGYKLGELLDFNECLFLSLLIEFISLGGTVIFILMENFALIIIFICLYNMGNTISSLISVRNCCKFFHRNLGFVYGIYFFGNYFGSLVYTNIGKLIIKKKDPLFIRNKYLLITQTIITLICGIVAMILNNKHSFEGEQNYSRFSSSANDSRNIEEHFEETISDYNLSYITSSYTSSLILFKANTKKIFFSNINRQFIYISICDFCKLFIYLFIYFIFI